MKYKKGYKYQLVEDVSFRTALCPPQGIVTYYITLPVDGRMTVRRGYAWDGPSGPTIDTKNSMRATLFHDAAYQLLRQGLLEPEWRTAIDLEFDRFLKYDGMSKWRRKLWITGLKWFGASAADPKNQKKVFTVL